MDIAGKMPPAHGQKVFMLAMTDYFLEVDRSTGVQTCHVKRGDLIHQKKHSMQVCLKKRPTSCKGKWVEELPWVLWSDRSTPKMSTGQTPYSLVYGTEAVLLIEIMMPTSRYGLLTCDMNSKELTHNVDIVDKLREMARIHMVSYQQRVSNTYNKHVHVRSFRVGDLVLRKTFQNTMNVIAGKFADTWE
ncbi:uncharacterized protein LOC141664687 [Apium graveolens]|uniref:uncharacterized protein LOC141664687 n=1 Tax=Apium graveolens TaxID=4045 RepID=UPI003D7AE5ED